MNIDVDSSSEMQRGQSTQVKSLADFREQWMELVAKAFWDYDSLTHVERVWFNIESLIEYVDNGGFIGFYRNHGGDYWAETIEDLRTLGFDDIVSMLVEVNKYFPGSAPSRSIDERNAVIEKWGSSSELYYSIKDINNQFIAREDALEKRLVEFIEM